MSVAEIAALHGRYVRLSDKFKALWTFHQFASGVHKNFLDEVLPYNIAFQEIYDEIRRGGDAIQSSNPAVATQMMEKSERDLATIVARQIHADQKISASILRRFFEKLRNQDEKIIFNLIKFYLYADSIDGDQRDKLDFLFTRIAEEFIEERGEYSTRDSLELRKQIQSLVQVRPASELRHEQAAELIKTIRMLQDDVERVTRFEQFTERNLLERARELKHSIGDRFLHPDVLLAITACNISTKNRFAMLYRDEEQRMLDDAKRLLENESAIARGFGDTNPELLDEMERFKRFKSEFDESRAQSNVKHNVISGLKTSLHNILAQLDRTLDASAPVGRGEVVFEEEADRVTVKFGDDPVLNDSLVRLLSVLDSFDDEMPSEQVVKSPVTVNLRLETWEVDAYRKLYRAALLQEGETEELLLLYLRAAALRIRIEDQAGSFALVAKSSAPDGLLLAEVKESLDRAKELDQRFKDFLSDGIAASTQKALHRLYRSRLRLLRGFSGLWLVYDSYATVA